MSTTRIARVVLAALALALVAPRSGVAQAQAAYSLDDIIGLLRSKVASQRVLKLAEDNCLSFTFDAAAEARVRRAGGTAALIRGLKKVCDPDHPKEAPRPAVDTVTVAKIDTVQKVDTVKVQLAPPPPPVDTMVDVKIRAAIINPDLSVRALPLVDLWIIGPRGDTTTVSTDLEGQVTGTFKAGVYRIESAKPVTVDSDKYTWAAYYPFAKDMRPIELTNKNASVEHVATAPAAESTAVAAKPQVAKDSEPPAKRVNVEQELFEKYRTGLVTVFGRERGSGFLADSAGFVVTNAHLVKGAAEVRVQVDSTTKVYARIVAEDDAKDIAVLAIARKRCGACAVLPIAGDGAAPAPGERVLALGSPLNRLGVLSLGLVSNADASGVVSDVSVGYLNTGGPLVNLDGNVIGLNSVARASGAGGARVANSLPAADVAAALARARDSLPALALKPPSDTLLPVVPADPFPADPIRAVSALPTLELRPYRAEFGPFRVLIMTPQVAAWRNTQAQKALADRKQRDPRKAASWTRIDPIQGWRDWDTYVGDRRAVVIVNVTPEQTGFPFYDADKIMGIGSGLVKDMKLYRDGVEIVPTEKWIVPAVLNVDEYRAAGKNVPMQGIYVYRIEDFAPRAVGTVADYKLTIVDAANATRPYTAPIMGATVEQLWRDFAPYTIRRGR